MTVGILFSEAHVNVDNRWLKSRHQPPLVLTPLLAFLALAFCGCNAEGRRGPSRPLTSEELRGRDVFQADCSQCHNAYKKEPLQGPPLVGLFRHKEMPSGIPATDQHVRDTILLGRRNMPPFNSLIDEKQLNDLTAFLHTL